jgi:hypothetical protein
MRPFDGDNSPMRPCVIIGKRIDLLRVGEPPVIIEAQGKRLLS